MKRGTITRRGRGWRIKYEGPRIDGVRDTRYLTIRGSRQTAQAALTKLLAEVDSGIAVDPHKMTVAGYLHDWLWEAPHGLAGKTLERYQQLAEQQIIPSLGRVALTKLRPAQIRQWHGELLRSGLAPRSVGHAHRLLHTALERARADELVSRNVVGAIKPPKVMDVEVQILTADQVKVTLEKLAGHWLYPIVVMATGTGLRRGELLATRWQDLDLRVGEVRVYRSIEQTRAGLTYKEPKTRAGRRVVPLPAACCEALRRHKKSQLEFAVQAGAGRPELVFSTIDGNPIPPNNLSRDWRRTVKSLGLPVVSFHGLRHTFASALIASGLDVVRVSKLLGHAGPAVTLRVYSHMFDKPDSGAAAILQRVLK